MIMSGRDARGPEDHERHWSGALPAKMCEFCHTRQWRCAESTKFARIFRASFLARCTRLVYTARMGATLNFQGDWTASAAESICFGMPLGVPSSLVERSG